MKIDEEAKVEDDVHAGSYSSNIFHDDAYNAYVENLEKQMQTKTSKIDMYLSEPVVKIAKDVNFNILEYWKNNEIKYKTLAAMAKDILSIPMSTVASESAFNTRERLFIDHRSSLKSEAVEALICAQDWLRPRYEGVADPNQEEEEEEE